MFVNNLNMTNKAALKNEILESNPHEFKMSLILPMEDKWMGSNVTCCYLSIYFGKDCDSRSPIKGMFTALTWSG